MPDSGFGKPLLLSKDALFVDLVAQTADAGLPQPPRRIEKGFRVECLTGWDEAYVWYCGGDSGRPRSRLSSEQASSLERRLGFPCWVLQEGTESLWDQFRRMQRWPYLLICACKINPLAKALGGVRSVQETVERIKYEFSEEGAQSPVCALTQGSNEIVAFVNHPNIHKSLAMVHKISRAKIGEYLVSRFRLCHGFPTPDMPMAPVSNLHTEFRKWRYEDTLSRLSDLRRPGQSDSGLYWGLLEAAPAHEHIAQIATNQHLCRGTLTEAEVAEAEERLARQTLVARTNTTVCWRLDASARSLRKATAGKPFLVALTGSVDGPDEVRAGKLIHDVLMSDPALGFDGIPLGSFANRNPPVGGGGGTAPEQSSSASILAAYGPDDIHAGLVAFNSLHDLNLFFQRLWEQRLERQVLLRTVSVPVRSFAEADIGNIDQDGLLPAPPFCAADILCCIEAARSATQRARIKAGAAYQPIVHGLTDLHIAARALLTNAEIAADADDLLAALWHLPHVAQAELLNDRPWAVVQLVKFLTLAVYEREQTLWAEAAPPGAPFHSEGVGLQQLAKAVEYLIGYVVNYAQACGPFDEERLPRQSLYIGRYRASQVSVRREELTDEDALPWLHRKWNGCVCLGLLQGVYTSPGGIIHFTDMFAQQLATTVPRLFHEIGHILYDKSGAKEDALAVITNNEAAINQWMRGFGAAKAPIMRIVEEAFAHWIEFELFDRDVDFCVRSLWQGWLSSPYLKRHPVDALWRTATLFLLNELLVEREHYLREAILGRHPEIQMDPQATDDLLEAVVRRTVSQAVDPQAPFGIDRSEFPTRWIREVASARQQHFMLVDRTLRSVVLPFLRQALVKQWDISENLRGLLDLEYDDYDFGRGEPPTPSLYDDFWRQQYALREGRIVHEPLKKPVRQVLEAHRAATSRNSKADAANSSAAKAAPASVLDMSLLFTLAHIWDVNSTYSTYIARPREYETWGTRPS